MKLFRPFDRLTEFFRREDGTASIEAVIWMPVFALIIGLVADTSIIFGDRALVMQEAQNVTRDLAVGQFTSTSAAQSYLVQEVQQISPHATVSVTINSLTNIITTSVAMPTSDLGATGLVAAFYHSDVYVYTSQLSEA